MGCQGILFYIHHFITLPHNSHKAINNAFRAGGDLTSKVGYFLLYTLANLSIKRAIWNTLLSPSWTLFALDRIHNSFNVLKALPPITVNTLTTRQDIKRGQVHANLCQSGLGLFCILTYFLQELTNISVLDEKISLSNKIHFE